MGWANVVVGEQITASDMNTYLVSEVGQEFILPEIDTTWRCQYCAQVNDKDSLSCTHCGGEMP